jgi:molybdopterin-biosynthesis enzyme MoeA-like protein
MIISLPGVPEEMRWIFENRLIPLLGGGEGAILVERIISLSVRDETTLSPMIDEVMRSIPNIYVKSMVKPYGESSIRIWITATGASREEAEDKIERALQLLSRLVERQSSTEDGECLHP